MGMVAHGRGGIRAWPHRAAARWRRLGIWRLPLDQRLVVFMAGFGFLAFWLGIYGFNRVGHPDLLYTTLQMYAGSFPDSIRTAVGSPLFVARLLALTAALFGTFAIVLSMVRFPFDKMMARRARGHIVVMGDVPGARLLVERLAVEERPAGWPRRGWRRPVVWIGPTVDPNWHAHGVRRVDSDAHPWVSGGLNGAARVVILYDDDLDATHALDRVLRVGLVPGTPVHVGLPTDSIARTLAEATARTDEPDQIDLDPFCVRHRVLSAVLDAHTPTPRTRVLIVGSSTFAANLTARIGDDDSVVPCAVYPGAASPDLGADADTFALDVERWVSERLADHIPPGPEDPAEPGDTPYEILLIIGVPSDDRVMAAATRAARRLSEASHLTSQVVAVTQADARWGRRIAVDVRVYSAEETLSDPEALTITPYGRAARELSAAASAANGTKVNIDGEEVRGVVGFLTGWRYHLGDPSDALMASAEPGDATLRNAATSGDSASGHQAAGPLVDLAASPDVLFGPGLLPEIDTQSREKVTALLVPALRRSGVFLQDRYPPPGCFVDRLAHLTARHVGAVTASEPPDGFPELEPFAAQDVFDAIAGLLGLADEADWGPTSTTEHVACGPPRWWTSAAMARVAHDCGFSDRDDRSRLHAVAALEHVPLVLAERGLRLTHPEATVSRHDLWHAARQAHLEYESRFGSDRPTEAETHAKWRDETVFFRDQNMDLVHRTLAYDAWARLRSREGNGDGDLTVDPGYGRLPDVAEEAAGLPEHTRFLAAAEHEAWWYDRARKGWRMGARNDAQRTHPMMKSFDDLDWPDQQRDINAIVTIPKVLAMLHRPEGRAPGRRG